MYFVPSLSFTQCWAQGQNRKNPRMNKHQQLPLLSISQSLGLEMGVSLSSAALIATIYWPPHPTSSKHVTTFLFFPIVTNLSGRTFDSHKSSKQIFFLYDQFPEMNAMIMRRFSLPGDVDRAQQYVLQSDGVQQTTYLAQRYCHEAVREISKLRPSPERDALIQLSEIVLTRDK